MNKRLCTILSKNIYAIASIIWKDVWRFCSERFMNYKRNKYNVSYMNLIDSRRPMKIFLIVKVYTIWKLYRYFYFTYSS